jgi:tetratricopeptide (TPR) repeat protein
MNQFDPVSNPSNRRLDSWKEIASFFGRDERTVRRWEKERSLPVHRMPGKPRGSVYAFTAELSQWLNTPNFPREEEQKETNSDEPEVIAGEGLPRTTAPEPLSSDAVTSRRRGDRRSTDAESPVTQTLRGRRELRYLAVALAILAALVAVAVTRRNWSARAARKDAPAATPHAINPEAEQLYLKGIYYFNKRTPDSLNQAVDYFTQAVVRDPQYAEAYVGMADCYNLLREYSVMPPAEAYPRAAAAAKRAIAINDSLSGAHRSLAFVDFYWYLDIPGAQHEFQRALELDPSSALTHHWYATFLLHMVRFPESLREIDQAQKLDPHSTSVLADKGLILFYAGYPDQSVALLKQLETSEPDFLSPHNYMAFIYLVQKNWPQFLAESRKAATLLHDDYHLAMVAAGEKGLARAGSRGMFQEILKVQQARYATGQERAFNVAETAALLGETQQALDLLQVSYAKRDPDLTRLRLDPQLSSLHDEPVYRDLLAKMGLPPLP